MAPWNYPRELRDRAMRLVVERPGVRIRSCR